ncbi:MAG TPA: glycosyltransferase family 9 protein [Pyrinomonadaceae bacterium]|nr:glycosyltransferase family 9 protein [Pyrinomonadaceae bacterium]
MNSLRAIVESAPQFRKLAMQALRDEDSPQPLGSARWDWQKIERILVVRLRSIGDTVLATPSLFALKRFLPRVRIDVLLEDWVAPVLEGFEYVDNVLTLKAHSTASRVNVVRRLRAARYDVAFNLHGGTTATFLTRASGATHRVGYASYRYKRLHNHLAPSSLLLWGRETAHSVEQQLALLGWTGVPVSDRPPTQLAVTEQAAMSVAARIQAKNLDQSTPLAMIHPAAAFQTKQWAVQKFAEAADKIAKRGFNIVTVTTPLEAQLARELGRLSSTQMTTFTDLSLPEVAALAARARLFLGNDSGIAHIAAAVGTPSVVVFGSSNVAHWRPWPKAPAEIVREEMDCQPCHGYYCEKFAEPECIKRVPVERVMAAVDRVLQAKEAH